MSWFTISGTSSGTLNPATGLTVSGGCDTCSGSHYVNYSYSYYIPSPSGIYPLSEIDSTLIESGVPAYDYALLGEETYILVYQRSPAVPEEIREGLIAWHSLDEPGLTFSDSSGNNIIALGTNNILSVTGTYGYASAVGDLPYGHIDTSIPTQSGEYMCSFWMQPTELVTSGSANYFTLFESDAFYGEHFKDNYDYKGYPVYKGWLLLNTATTCSAGYQGDYLKFKGTSNTNWFASTWASANLYFNVSKIKDWTIETKFLPSTGVAGDQKAGLIIFDKANYLNYSSLLLAGESFTYGDLIESSIFYMTSANTPSPLVVSQSSYYSSSSIYIGWRAYDNIADGNYWHSGDGVLPDWWQIDTSSSGNKVIQGYRMQRTNSHFPKDWTFLGSNNGSSWDTLHTMVGQTDPGENNWCSWYYFSNTTAYRYYRINITKSQSGTSWTCFKEIQFYVKEYSKIPVQNKVILNTRDLSYTVAEHLTASGTWYFKAKKRSGIISLDFRNEFDDRWTSSAYYIDTSSWGVDLRVGLLSYNSGSDSAPEILIDYVKFEDGEKPSSVGDPEIPGRLLVTYNKININSNIEERTDGRIWLQTNRDGFAYGTSTYKWDPTQWYLIQFGVKPNADKNSDPYDFDYCWWVNGKRERGLIVGSGTGAAMVIPSGQPFVYFDSDPLCDNKNLFKIDEVSHWSRWLSAEEILKMWSPVSQVAWHKTEPNIESSEDIYTAPTTLSGDISEWEASQTVVFDYYRQYTYEGTMEYTARMQTVSYRIQKDLIEHTARLGQVNAKIIRYSSGWSAIYDSCFCSVDVLPYSTSSITASQNPTYGTNYASNLFDKNAATYYSSGAAPATTSCYIKLSYPLTYPNPRTAWKSIRCRAYSNVSYWLRYFPKGISIWGSNLTNPSITTASDWSYIMDLTISPPTVNNGWGGWTTLSGQSLCYDHYRIKFLTNYGTPTSDWIVFSEMEIEAEGIARTIWPDVRADVGIQSISKPTEYLPFYLTPTTVASESRMSIVAHDQVNYRYTKVYYDFSGPSFIDLQPERNERRVSPMLDWDMPSEGRLTIKDYGGSIKYPKTRVWINHLNQGNHKYIRNDNFSFYELDIKSLPTVTGTKFVTASGEGWTFINPQNTNLDYINKGMEFITDSDYSATVGSGYHLLTSTYTIENCKEVINKDSYRFNPVTYGWGSKALEISTVSGAWLAPGKGVPQALAPVGGNYSAPFTYTTIPSGIDQWTVETKFFVEREGDQRGQYAGLQVTYEDDPSKYYQFIASASGIAVQSEVSPWDQAVCSRSGVVSDDMWMRITKSGSALNFYWSEDGIIWSELSPPVAIHNPLLTSNNGPSPYRCWADSELDSGKLAWNAFDGTPCAGYWQTPNTFLPHWLAFDCGQPTIVYYYQLVGAQINNHHYYPENFSLQASDNGTGWKTVSTDFSYDYMSCGSGIIYQVQRPGPYRYYRLYINSTSCSEVASYAMLGQLNLFGNFSSTVNTCRTDSNYLVGPIVISERNQHRITTSETMMPDMTSNTTPSPLVASASVDNANAFRAFGAWGWHPSNPLPYWVQIDFGRTVLIQGIRWSEWVESIVTLTELKGSNDLSTWTSLFYWDALAPHRQPYGVSGGMPDASLTEFFRFPNSNKYRYYRFYIYRLADDHNHTYIYYIKFYGGDNAAIHEITPAYTYANFDYVKVTVDSGIENILIGDPWELLLDGKTPLNSATNSCVSSFTETDVATHTLGYYPKSNLAHGSPVFMRAEVSDTESFKLSYDPMNSYLLLSISGAAGVPITNRIPNQLWDASVYEHKVYASYGFDEAMVSGYLITTTGIVYEGQCAIEKNNALAYLHTQDFPATYFNSDWTIDLWSYVTATPSGNIFSMRSEVAGVETNPTRLRTSWTSSGINLYQNEVYLRTFTLPDVYALNNWQHFALVKNDGYMYAYYRGIKLGSQALVSGTLVMPTESGCINFFSGHTGYIDMLNWRKTADWTTMRSLIYSNSVDEIWMYTPTDWKDLSVEINAVQDTSSPVVIPLGPLPSASGVCPASGISFDIVDDMSGIYWDSVKIIVDNLTVMSGGNNMTSYYPDRGTLVWEERGQKNGEWIVYTEASVSGEVYYDGINRQLYPPGTAYSGSGAWGRRFTYNVPDDTELTYFDKNIIITITGTDSVGYGSSTDDIQPNPFELTYDFDFITNDNISIGNFFLNVGESERIDILQAQGRVLYVDMWDTNYPTTDIVEEESYLHFTDGVESFVCSGTWFTTWTGTGGLIPSGIVAHRMYYDAGDYYWDGHRTMQYTVHAQNNDPLCHAYNECTYNLLYGWHIFWLHGAQYLPFDFDKKLPVFVSIKTQEYVPSRFSKSYMIWTAPAITHDFSVELKALPLGGGNELEVDLVAHSHYLQYSEDVEVEVSCQDRDGNAMVYTWTFRTEDEP